MQQGPGYGHPQQGHQAPPPKQGMPGWAKVLIALGLLGLCGVGGCIVCVGVAGKAVSDAEKDKQAEVQKAKDAPASEVQIDTLLSEYKGNEVKADGLYKDKSIRVAGTVDDVKKGLAGGMYITLGSGKKFEIPQVQCHLEESETAKASALTKGQKVTVAGRVTGLMGHVQLRPCSIL